MEDDEGLYTLKLQGEKHKYELRGSEHHTLGVVSTTLSDLTGYKPEYLREKILADMKIGKTRRVKIANNMTGIAPMDFGTPHFIVKRVS